MTEPLGATTAIRPDIQGLRAIAVLLVILCHMGVPGFGGGFIGVDIFFVISGFVITQTLVTHRTGSLVAQLKFFYQRRILRIVPAATTVLLVTLIASYLFFHRQLPTGILENSQWAALFAGNFYLIHVSADYFIQGATPLVLTHYWSLAVEEQFYLVFPCLLLVLGLSKNEKVRRWVWWLALLVIIIGSFIYSLHQSSTNAVLAYYSLFTRSWELAFGGLVALAPRIIKPPVPVFSDILIMISLGVLVKAMFVINPNSIYPGSLAWLAVAPTGGLLLAGAANQSFIVRVIGSQPLRFIGDISFSLYLYHYVWLILPEYFRNPLVSRQDRIVEMAGAVACAILSTYLLENPIKRSKRLRGDGWSTLLVLGIGVSTVFSAVFVVSYLVRG
jgi:peptidoglycan/LPS O-acetylase OafA/YrhL